MSERLDEVIAARPELTADTPFVAIVDALMDATVAVAKVVDLVTEDPDTREEFFLRDEDEQTMLGTKVVVASLSIRALAEEFANAVGDLFADYRIAAQAEQVPA